MNTIENELKIYLPEELKIFDVCESETSTYFYLINKDDDISELNEDDNRLIKLRLSNHEAMTYRSWSHFEIIYSCDNNGIFYINEKGENITKEYLSEKYNMFLSDFDNFEIEQEKGNAILSSKDYSKIDKFFAKKLIHYLENK